MELDYSPSENSPFDGNGNEMIFPGSANNNNEQVNTSLSPNKSHKSQKSNRASPAKPTEFYKDPVMIDSEEILRAAEMEELETGGPANQCSGWVEILRFFSPF